MDKQTPDQGVMAIVSLFFSLSFFEKSICFLLIIKRYLCILFCFSRGGRYPMLMQILGACRFAASEMSFGFVFLQ